MDFFCGAGEYTDKERDAKPANPPPKERGSSLIILDAIVDYLRSKPKNIKVQNFNVFINDLSPENLENTKRLVYETVKSYDFRKENNYHCAGTINSVTINIKFYNVAFEVFQVDDIDHTSPIFFFIDPFGYKQLPFETVEKLLQFEKPEIFVNLMVNALQRGMGRANLLDTIDSSSIEKVLGTSAWRDALPMERPTDEDIGSFYCQQLKKKA